MFCRLQNLLVEVVLRLSILLEFGQFLHIYWKLVLIKLLQQTLDPCLPYYMLVPL